MPIVWKFIGESGLIDACVTGPVGLQDFTHYVDEVSESGCGGHPKLVDMTYADLSDLHVSDVRALAHAIVRKSAEEVLGPVAIVVDAVSSLDFVALFEDYTSHVPRLLAIFANREQAMAWLKTASRGELGAKRLSSGSAHVA